MSDWQPIETAPDDLRSVILWNGVAVFTGWRAEDGWHDDRNADHTDDPEDPQPTHWMPLPDPPRDKSAGRMSEATRQAVLEEFRHPSGVGETRAKRSFTP